MPMIPINTNIKWLIPLFGMPGWSLYQQSFKMFENSLISRLTIRCPEHPKNIITHICTDTRCQTWPLFCDQCKATYRYKQKHYGHELNVMELGRGVEEICSRLARDKDAVGIIYREMTSVKGVQGLLKWQEEKEQHFTAIEKHINTLKFQIEEELSNIVKQFQSELEMEKLRLYTELERYESNYREKFDKFSRLTQPIVALQNRFKFYASPSAFVLKISNEAGTSKLGVWLSDLKHTLNLTQKAAATPAEYSQQIRKYGETANQIMDDLPRIKNIQYQKQMPLIIGTSVKDILHSFVNLKEPTNRLNSSPFVRSTSVDNFQSDAHKWKHSVSYK